MALLIFAPDASGNFSLSILKPSLLARASRGRSAPRPSLKSIIARTRKLLVSQRDASNRGKIAQGPHHCFPADQLGIGRRGEMDFLDNAIGLQNKQVLCAGKFNGRAIVANKFARTW